MIRIVITSLIFCQISFVSLAHAVDIVTVPEMMFMAAEELFEKRFEDPKNALTAAQMCRKLARSEEDNYTRKEYSQKEGEFITFYLNYLITQGEEQTFCRLYEETKVLNQPYDAVRELYIYSPYSETQDNLKRVYQYASEQCR